MLFFFKQKTAYDMLISDWSSDVCSSDLLYPFRRNARARPSVMPRWFGLSQPSWGSAADTGTGSHAAGSHSRYEARLDRKRVVQGQSVSVRVDRGGRRINKKRKKLQHTNNNRC